MIYRHSIHVGRDDPIEIEVTDRGVLADITNATRWVLTTAQGETVDSDDDATLWDQDNGGGVLIFKPGSSLTETGEGYAELVMYDAANLNGITIMSDCTRDKLYLTICA